MIVDASSNTSRCQYHPQQNTINVSRKHLLVVFVLYLRFGSFVITVNYIHTVDSEQLKRTSLRLVVSPFIISMIYQGFISFKNIPGADRRISEASNRRFTSYTFGMKT